MAEILDSGVRREFETGAVRDIVEGKGRFDLMPLDALSMVLNGDTVIAAIWRYIETESVGYLACAVRYFAQSIERTVPGLMLDVAKHFEDGAQKYGENNWQKGLPESCYIDSAIRHYMKYLDGWDDEPHDRAFVWNLMCLIWTHDHITVKKGDIVENEDQG